MEYPVCKHMPFVVYDWKHDFQEEAKSQLTEHEGSGLGADGRGCEVRWIQRSMGCRSVSPFCCVLFHFALFCFVWFGAARLIPVQRDRRVRSSGAGGRVRQKQNEQLFGRLNRAEGMDGDGVGQHHHHFQSALLSVDCVAPYDGDRAHRMQSHVQSVIWPIAWQQLIGSCPFSLASKASQVLRCVGASSASCSAEFASRHPSAPRSRSRSEL